MRAFAGLVLVASAFLASSAGGASGTATPDRPPGIAAADWVPLSSSLGVVLVHAQRPPAFPARDATALLLVPPEEDYLMVRRGSRWVRLVVVDPAKGAGVAG
jgi:hypothetical protein